MSIQIRRAIPEDAPGIARVHVDSWRSTYRGLLADDFLHDLSYEQREIQWAEAIDQLDSPSFLLVAVDPKGGPLGFVSAGPEQGGDPIYRGEIQAIYLLESAQGQGIGRRLMQAAVRELRARSFANMLLWVLKPNLGARRFYEALGGSCLQEKSIEIGGREFMEIAYGWPDLSVFPMKEE